MENEIEKRFAIVEQYVKGLAESIRYLKARDEEIISLTTQIKEALREFRKLKKDVRAIKAEVERQRNVPLKGPW